MAAVALSLAASAISPGTVSAQCAMGATRCTVVHPDGKGIIGLGLLGAELGLIIPALAGVRDEWWPYLVFPLIGAVGGAIGGWAVEQATPNDPEIDVALMAIGMVLIVPTVVGTLALSAYQPPTAAVESDDDWEVTDSGGGGTAVEAEHDGSTPEEAPAEGSTEGGAAPAAGTTSSRDATAAERMRGLMAGGRGILRFELGNAGGPGILIAAPLPYSVSSYTAEETARLRLIPQNDFIVPVVSATF